MYFYYIPRSGRSFTTHLGSGCTFTTYPGSGCTFTTYPGRGAVLLHTCGRGVLLLHTHPGRSAVLLHIQVRAQFYYIPRSERSFTIYNHWIYIRYMTLIVNRNGLTINHCQMQYFKTSISPSYKYCLFIIYFCLVPASREEVGNYVFLWCGGSDELKFI